MYSCYGETQFSDNRTEGGLSLLQIDPLGVPMYPGVRQGYIQAKEKKWGPGHCIVWTGAALVGLCMDPGPE